MSSSAQKLLLIVAIATPPRKIRGARAVCIANSRSVNLDFAVCQRVSFAQMLDFDGFIEIKSRRRDERSIRRK